MVRLQKMPTIAVYQDGQKVKQHIAAETGSSSVAKVGHIRSIRNRAVIELLTDMWCCLRFPSRALHGVATAQAIYGHVVQEQVECCLLKKLQDVAIDK